MRLPIPLLACRAAGRGSAVRAQQLEAQVEEVKAAAARRIRLLETKLKEQAAVVTPARTSAIGGSTPLAAVQQPAAAAMGPQATAIAAAKPMQERLDARLAAAQQEAVAAATASLQKRVRRLEAELARKDAEVAALQKRCATGDAQLNSAAEQQVAAAEEAAALRQAVAEVKAANDGLQSQVQQLPVLRQRLIALQQEADGLRQQSERLRTAEAAVAALERQAACQAERLSADLLQMRQEQAAALERALQAGREASTAEWQPRVLAAGRAATEAQGRVEQLERDLRAARAGLPWTPAAADFAALERRMVEAGQRAGERERCWRAVAEDARRAAEAQQERLRQQYQGALATRLQQLDGVRRQLDGLLAAARLLADGPGGTHQN